MRTSTVPYPGLGRMSHQISLTDLMAWEATMASKAYSNSAQLLNTQGCPAVGKASKMVMRDDARPVSCPCQKGELADNASTCGR